MNLAQGLLRRFESQSMPSESFDPTNVFPKFIHFLLLSQQMNEDDEIHTFLSLLDNGINKPDVNLFNLKNTLTDKEKLWKVAGLKNSRGLQYKELRGYSKFIAFSIELDDLLQSISDFPLFQSACYQYHKYWYARFGKQLAELSEEVESAMSEHNPSQRNSNQIAETCRVSGNAAITRLTGTQYAQRYESALRNN
jgi:hypothetical protein